MTWTKSQQSGNENTVEDNQRKKMEPDALFTLFANHWTQVSHIMERYRDSEGASTVISHISQMIAFLAMSRGELVPSEYSCKSFWIQHRCPVHVLRWLHGLLIQGVQMPEQDELKLIGMLHSLCEAASRDGEILGLVMSPSSSEQEHDSWEGTFALASVLLEYSLRKTLELAETARYSFIQVIQLASRYPVLERSLVEESGLGITNVVVSGLSACFAQLPTFTNPTDEHLSPFVDQLKFVDDIAHAAPDKLAEIIAYCFKKAFLLTVMEPALTQSLNEEIGVLTFYLEVICRKISHPLLVKALVEFVNTKLLHVLISRISTNDSVSVTVSTLSLFIALLELYCEDFWVEVALKYLTPQHHLMISQRFQSLPQLDYYDSATQFLNILPARLCNVVGPEATEQCFIKYINQASFQWSKISAAVRAAISVTSPDAINGEHMNLKNGERETDSHMNQMFPAWKYKYDGETGLTNGVSHDIACNNLHDPNTQGNADAEHEHHTGGPSVFQPLNMNPESSLTNISLENGTVQSPLSCASSSELLTALQENHTQVCASVEDVSILDRDTPIDASFGPFLDSVFLLLSNWVHLDLNLILVLTQVISLLAASRIPLINTMLLNSSVILQPYYLSFNTLLKKIEEDLEYQLKDVPQEVLQNVWEANCSNRDDLKKENSGLAISVSQSFGEQLSDTLRRTITGGGTEALASVWRRFSRKSAPEPSAASKPQFAVHPSSGAILRKPEAKEDPQLHISTTMTLRLVYFFNWLLELGAIAQQHCWEVL